MKDGDGAYHRHIVENFNDLDQASKNALCEAGFVKDTTKEK